VVAATFEKAITYVFAELAVWDREVGGSNPLAPTTNINNLRLPALAAVFLVWPICGRTDGQLSNHVFALRHQNLRLPEKLRDLAFWPRRLHLLINHVQVLVTEPLIFGCLRIIRIG